MAAVVAILAAVTLTPVAGAAAHTRGRGASGPQVAAAAKAVGAPAAPAPVCGKPGVLSGPAAPPSGAVAVAAGKDTPGRLSAPDTVYWFAPGTHTLPAGKYSQIDPAPGDTYLGAPGAVLSGQGDNYFAFGGTAAGVTIEYLTIQDFGTRGGNGTQGVVNHTSASDWVVDHDTVQHNAGAGVMLGSGDRLESNCLQANQQYGFSAYSTAGTVSGLVVTGNEVAGNATYDWTAVRPDCGCSGGAKFWETQGAVVTGNYVHDNRSVGLWVDTDNTGFDISGNYLAHNWAEAIMYEISYNALISHNTLVDNGWPFGSKPTAGFPEPAIYVSESGAAAAVPGPYSGTFVITDNALVDNWSGVILWENANRFCGDQQDGACTLVDPSVYTISSCRAHLPTAAPSANPDYFDNCRWKTTGVRVTGNRFSFTPGAVGTDCTRQRLCGYTGVFSEYGTVAPFKAWVVPEDLADEQHNVFAGNTYRGPWRFDGFALGVTMTWAQWTHGMKNVDGSGDSFPSQDAGSSYHR